MFKANKHFKCFISIIFITIESSTLIYGGPIWSKLKTLYEENTKPLYAQTKPEQRLFLEKLPLGIRKKIGDYAVTNITEILPLNLRKKNVNPTELFMVENAMAHSNKLSDNSLEFMNVLAILGADIQKEEHATALFFNIKKHSDQPNCIKFIRLLHHHSVNLNIATSINGKGTNKRTILHHTAAHNNIPVLKTLIARKVFLNLKDYQGETALDIAQKHNNFESYDLLKKAGAKSSILSRKEIKKNAYRKKLKNQKKALHDQY